MKGNEYMSQIKALINEEELHNRIVEIAKQIEKEYHNKEITLICILKGSVFFTVELAKQIDEDVRLEFIRVSSYEGENSTGEIKMKLDLKDTIQGKDVIVVEDIIDTGRTLSYLIEYLKMKRPNSVKLCTLLDKPDRRVCDVKVDYVGFQIPDKFVVGFGLDADEKYRNLPYIGVIE
jgi:hypoxanthine phosphoribosyltransferase